MRACLTVVVLCVVAFVPIKGSPQAYSALALPTPPPLVTAASADWQIRGEPVFYAGSFYYPTGPNVFFDGNVMFRTGVYRGVSLYIDASVDPIGLVYVPIGGGVMRPYERPRSGELAGTIGNRTPSFPIELDVEASTAAARIGTMAPPFAENVEPNVLPEYGGRRTIGTDGATGERPATYEEPLRTDGARPGNTIVESIPPPRMNSGVWLEFDGTPWYSAGPAVPYSADRFTLIGDHCGFPVYRDKAGTSDEIFVAAVKDGPVAPYKR
jgi:hypothetical protein